MLKIFIYRRELYIVVRESCYKVENNSYYEYDGRYVYAKHSAVDSIRICIISLFECLIGYIDKKKEREDLILFQTNELLKIIEDENYYYSEILPEMLELQGRSKKNIKNIVFQKRLKANKDRLLLSEKSVIRTIAEGILGEYAMQTKYTKIDFGAMRVQCELGQQIFKSGILSEKSIMDISIIVENDELKSWKINYSDINDIEKTCFQNTVLIHWVDLNNMNHFSQINNVNLFGLSEGSKSNLTTAMAIEKEFINDKNGIFSYNSLAILYLGIVESEIASIIRKLDDTKEYKQLMWHDISCYCKNNVIPILSEKLPIYEILKELRPIRNRVAHGEFIKEEEFEKIKLLTQHNQLIEFISWAKIDLGIVSEE